MTDVLKIAKDRRAVLKAEVEKLEEFIRTADSLIKHGRLILGDRASTPGLGATGPSAPIGASKGPAPTTRDGAVAKSEDSLALKAGAANPAPASSADRDTPFRKFAKG
jgi:hypothetical protein